MATTIIRSGSKATIIMSGQGVPGPSGATASHWVGHKKGGVDEGKVEELATAGTIGSVPTSDGAGGLTMSVPAGGGNVTSPGGETANRLAFFTGANAIDDTSIDPSVVEVTTNKNSASGYAGLDGASKLTGTQQVYGVSANTACEGDDARLSDARTPTGTATGDLSGTYPAPTVDALQGTAVSAVAPTAGQVLTEVGGVWTATAPTGGVTDHGALTGLADDDHGQYQLRTEKDAASGYAGLNGSSKLTGSQQVYGSASDTATEGDDTRVPSQGENDALVGTDGTPSTSNKYVTNSDARNTDSRAPNGSASGDLSGSYPGPVVSALTETTGPQKLTVGAVADGQFLQRSGTALIGSTPGGSGDVVGPASAVDGNIPSYDGATGKLIQDSGISTTDLTTLTAGPTSDATALHQHDVTGLENVSSGWMSGGAMTINGGDNTLFDLASITISITNWSSGSPVHTGDLTFGPFIGETLPDVVGDRFTQIFINASGALVKIGDAFVTPQQRRQLAVLQIVQHPGVVIEAFGTNRKPAYEVEQSLLDYTEALGPVNSGNLFTAAATDLTVKKEVGSTTQPFINQVNDAQSPSVKANAEITSAARVVYSYRDFPTGFIVDITNVVADPNQYDDGSGTLQPVPPNKWTIQRCLFIGTTDEFAFIYGQALYNSKAEATANIFLENPAISPLFNAVFTTALVVEDGATDLTDLSEAEFITIASATTGGGGGGGSETWLGLLDTTTSSYVGLAGFGPQVTAGETGLELVENPTAHNTSTAAHLNLSKIDGSIAYTGEVAGITPTVAASLSTMGYVDGEVLNLLDLAGTRVMTGDLQMGTQAITNAGNVTLADGVLSQSTAGAGTTAVASWAALGSSGGAHQLFSTDVDPNSVVTGNPGDWCVRADGADSRTYQHRGTGASNTDWVEIGVAVALGGGLFGSIWRFDDDVTASDPASGRFKYNNASPPSVTIVRQHEIDRGGADRTNFLSQVDTDDLIYAQEETTGDRSDLFLVVSKVTQTNHVDFTVTHVASGPSLIRNNRDCIVGFQVVLDHTHAHSDLTGLTSGDDHTQYQLRSEEDAASGYVGLTAGSKISNGAFQVYGAASDTACVGNDARLSDSRAPNGSATGDLTGSYPAPVVSAVTTTTGPTSMVVGAVADGEFLKRVGSTIVGDTPSGGSGDVVGPASAVDNRVASFDGVTGKLIQDSGVLSTVLELTTNKNAASGYAGLNGSSKLTGSQQVYGTGVNTACVGNDARLSDSRAPNGSASGDLTGSYPSPVVSAVTTTTGPTSLVVGAVADGEFLKRVGSTVVGDTPAGGGDVVGPASSVDNRIASFDLTTGKLIQDSGVLVADVELLANKNAVSGYAGLDGSSEILGTQIKYGTGADTACEGNDSRLSDSRAPNGSATGDLSGTYPSPVVAAITTTTGPTQLTIAGIATSTILQRSGSTIIGTILGADLIQRDGSVNYTGNQNFGNNSITNVNLVDAVDVNLVASRTHFWGLTINGPLTAAKSNEQLLVLPFDCTITEIVVIALTTITTGDFTFRVQCGPDDESYVGGDLVGAAVTLDNSNKKIRSGGAISFAALEDDRLSVDVTAATGTQPDTDHDANFNVMVYYTRPIS